MNIFRIIFVFLFLSSCSPSENKSIVIATSADNPPYEHMSAGEIVGFDIDLGNEIGKYLGRKIEIKNMEFNGLLASLATNNADMVVAALSVTEERQKNIGFSIPYADANIAILFRAQDNFSSEKDLKDKVVGSQLGTIWNLIAHNISHKYHFKTTSLLNNLVLVEELKNGRIDAVILEEAQVKKFIEKNPELASFSSMEQNSSFAIAFPLDSPLIEEVNEAIRALKDNGTISSLLKKWELIDNK